MLFLPNVSWLIYCCSWLASGLEEGLEVQGELLLQDSFLVWEPKSLIRKGRDRHLFLFELSLIFSKEIKDSSGRTKYLYKSRLRVTSTSTMPSTTCCEWLGDLLLIWSTQTSELGVTEHIEGDPCKFALWVGRTPTSDNKTVLKVLDQPRLLNISFSEMRPMPF